MEFEWFDPQPDHDFHGIKTLLRQLFDVDGQLLDLSALTDLILAQPLLGSTIKVEGNESDPYAFLSVINLKEHKDRPEIASLTNYLQERCKQSSKIKSIGQLMDSTDSACVGLLLTERLINLPAQVIPPMYKMLLEEIQWAIDEKEPYKFSHYLIVSKTYQEIVSALDADMGGSKKKKKKQKMALGDNTSTFLFHPEDEILQSHALCHGGYEYSKEGPEGSADSRRAFQEHGVKPQGHLMLIEATKLKDAVEAMENFVNQACSCGERQKSDQHTTM